MYPITIQGNVEFFRVLGDALADHPQVTADVKRAFARRRDVAVWVDRIDAKSNADLVSTLEKMLDGKPGLLAVARIALGA